MGGEGPLAGWLASRINYALALPGRLSALVRFREIDRHAGRPLSQAGSRNLEIDKAGTGCDPRADGWRKERRRREGQSPQGQRVIAVFSFFSSRTVQLAGAFFSRPSESSARLFDRYACHTYLRVVSGLAPGAAPTVPGGLFVIPGWEASLSPFLADWAMVGFPSVCRFTSSALVALFPTSFCIAPTVFGGPCSPALG